MEIMNKCQAKVEKTVPGTLKTFWKEQKVLKECPNEAKGTGVFCEEHGCFNCSLKPLKIVSNEMG